MQIAFVPSDESNRNLLDEFESLWAEAESLWERLQHTSAFHGYVSADYKAVFASLASLRGRVFTVLEWGSGLGIVTIMASRMGFAAYGIEAEADLVGYAEQFAAAYGPGARFTHGSFIPDDYEWQPTGGEDICRTVIDAPCGYDGFDMDLRDFDLVYAYPWPDEHALYHDIIREYGRRDTLFLSYDAREGMNLVRFDGR